MQFLQTMLKMQFLNKLIVLSNDLWVPVSSTGKVSDGWIRDLEFSPRLH